MPADQRAWSSELTPDVDTEPDDDAVRAERTAPRDDTGPSTESPPEPLDRLRHGEITLLGRIVDSSNGTFLVGVDVDDDAEAPCSLGDATNDLRAVYKPLRGERPLWDFPGGLFRREAAAYELAVALGWDMVPGTIVRDDAPLGAGSLQRFVDADFSEHYFTLYDDGHFGDQLRRMCTFDLLANNTDRKGGHVLVDAVGHLWGIDHGLCFAVEPKLRTVIWDFAGERIGPGLLDDVATLVDGGLPGAVTRLLATDEAEALCGRARAVLAAGRFPFDLTGRRVPWPLV